AAPIRFFACIGPMNSPRAGVGQPSRLPSRASRPRPTLGRDAPAAGGTPAPLKRSAWKNEAAGKRRTRSNLDWDIAPVPIAGKTHFRHGAGHENKCPLNL